MNLIKTSLNLSLAAGVLLIVGSCSHEDQLLERGAAAVERREPAGNWPQLFGPFNDATSSEDAMQLNLDWPAAGPPVKWRHAVGSGYSSPVVSGGRLIVFHRIGDEEILECLDAKTGQSLWADKAPTKFQDRWHYSSGPYSTPVIDGGRVFAVGAEGRMSCVELASGKRIWKRELHKDYTVPLGMFAVGASPLVVDGLVIFNLGARKNKAGIIALDAKTGRTVWTATDHGAGMATPRVATIHGQRHLFVFTQHGLVCLDPQSGSVRWIEKFLANNPEKINATSPLVHGDRILISAESKGSVCLRVLPDGTHETAWKTRRDLQSQFCTLIGIDGFAYGFHALDRTFRCLNLADGKLQWKWPAAGEDGVGRGSAVAVGNRFLLFGEHGKLASLEINSHKPLPKAITKRPLLKPSCFSSPALAGGLLYLRNEVETKDRGGKSLRQGEVICVDLRRRGP
jgi:outer membrane protein assembly factor BamB